MVLSCSSINATRSGYEIFFPTAGSVKPSDGERRMYTDPRNDGDGDKMAFSSRTKEKVPEVDVADAEGNRDSAASTIGRRSRYSVLRAGIGYHDS